MSNSAEAARPSARPDAVGARPAAGTGADARRPADDRAPARAAQPAVRPDGWQETRPHSGFATQPLNGENDYLSGEKGEIGRRVGGNEHELFVSSDAAHALHQQFEVAQPELIAVHDIATASSRKLLNGIAAASGRPLQKLVIRRQGYGTALATLEFVVLPTVDGRPVRLYSTGADADTAARQAIARTLLAHSRLGVVMVGELPSQTIAAALKPLHEAIVSGPWPNRNVLLLPLSSTSTLATNGIDLARGTGVTVRTTPQVTRPADAWAFITGTWTRLREHSPAEAARMPELAAFKPAAYQTRRGPVIAPSAAVAAEAPVGAAPVVLSMRPPASIPTSGFRPAEPTSVLERYVRQVNELNGMVSCCVFETGSGRVVTHAGSAPGAGELATHGNELLAAMMTTSRTLGFGHVTAEAAITLGSHHLLLRPVPKHTGLALHAVLDKTTSNLTLVRLQVQRMDPIFDETPPG